MQLIYDKDYNYRLGLLQYLHPFEGEKFAQVLSMVNDLGLSVISPNSMVSEETIDEYLNELMRLKVRNKEFVFRALEVPKIPFISFNYLHKKILKPMRLAVAGTILGAERALDSGGVMWNLSGGFHHASYQFMQGFCIYNDIAIAHQQLIKNGRLSTDDKVLIIDVDAHHGNGNAFSFREQANVHLLDMYNEDIYPLSGFTREQVDFPVPLTSGTLGKEYLARLSSALELTDSDYALAFIVAGTDVLAEDKLGGLGLSVEDVAAREKMILEHLQKHKIPAVVTGGGGYSKQSAKAVSAAIRACASL